MAKIAPFRGIVYNQTKAGNLEALVCPPYDIISPSGQQELYDKSRYNVVRLEFGQDTPQDTDRDNRYTRAATLFNQWLQSGVLLQSDTPAIYVYEMEHIRGGVIRRLRGFVCRVKIEDFDSGVVLPHENTLSGPKADRLNLLRTCRANFSHIYSLYSDPEARISSILAKITRPAGTEVSNGDGALHRLWTMTDKADIDAISREMADKSFFIADGHHRYETALNFRNEQRKAAGTFSGNESYNFVTMYLARLEDPGLTILPAHRALFNLPAFNERKFEDDLNRFFNMERFDFDERSEPAYRSKVIDKMAAQAEESHVFGMRLKGHNSYYLLTLRNETDMDRLIPDKSPAYRKLDVSILHHLVIDKLLGVKMETHKLGTNIDYLKEASEAVKRVQEGSADVIFFMNPTKVSEVKNVAAAGERMPQKATYFYPKLLTGLVMNKID